MQFLNMKKQTVIGGLMQSMLMLFTGHSVWASFGHARGLLWASGERAPTPHGLVCVGCGARIVRGDRGLVSKTAHRMNGYVDSPIVVHYGECVDKYYAEPQ